MPAGWVGLADGVGVSVGLGGGLEVDAGGDAGGVVVVTGPAGTVGATGFVVGLAVEAAAGPDVAGVTVTVRVWILPS